MTRVERRKKLEELYPGADESMYEYFLNLELGDDPPRISIMVTYDGDLIVTSVNSRIPNKTILEELKMAGFNPKDQADGIHVDKMFPHAALVPVLQRIVATH